MSKRFFANPYKFAVGLGTVLVCGTISGAMLYIREPLSALIFGILALIFVFPVFVYGSTVTIDEEGVYCSFLGIARKKILWSQVKETGVIGTTVFNKSNPDKTGDMYLYFSPKELNDAERFNLGMKWPPKDLIFLLYTKERTAWVQSMWSNKIHTYNTGKLHIE